MCPFSRFSIPYRAANSGAVGTSRFFGRRWGHFGLFCLSIVFWRILALRILMGVVSIIAQRRIDGRWFIGVRGRGRGDMKTASNIGEAPTANDPVRRP